MVGIPGCVHRVCTMVGIPRCISLYIPQGVYLPIYLRVYTSLYTQVVYTSLHTRVYAHPTTLGIPCCPLHRWSPYYTPGVLRLVYGERALGSRRENCLGESLGEG